MKITIGELLKKEREKQGFSSEEISERIKIHVHKIKAIEEGRREDLPSRVFTVGLIKSYAKELNLNMDKVNQLCLEFYQKDDELQKKISINNEEEPLQTQCVGSFQIPKKIAMGISIGVIFLLMVAIFITSKKMNSPMEESSSESMNPYTQKNPVQNFLETENNSDTQESDNKEDSSNTVKTKESGNPSDSSEDNKNINSTDKATHGKDQKEEKKNGKKEQDQRDQDQKKQDRKEQDRKEEARKKQDQREQDRKEEDRKKQDQREQDRKEEDRKKQDQKEQDQKKKKDEDKKTKSLSSSSNKLVINALRSIDFEVIWSDNQTQKFTLTNQDSKTLVFSKPIRIKISDGGSVKLSLNKEKGEIPGNPGQPIELTYP